MTQSNQLSHIYSNSTLLVYLVAQEIYFMQSVAKYREKIAFLKSWQDFQMLFVMKGHYVFNNIYQISYDPKTQYLQVFAAILELNKTTKTVLVVLFKELK